LHKKACKALFFVYKKIEKSDPRVPGGDSSRARHRRSSSAAERMSTAAATFPPAAASQDIALTPEIEMLLGHFGATTMARAIARAVYHASD
jgi:hypothetical protein